MTKSAIAIALGSLFATGCLLSPDLPFACREAGSCGECIELAGCGWCAARGCVSGTVSGPADVGLNCAGDYRWDECTPRVNLCSTHTVQDRCALASGCLWCPIGSYCTDLPSCTPTVPDWTRTGAAPRSSHPYADSTDESWALGVPPTATSVRVAFSRVELESCCDAVEILDASGAVVENVPSIATRQVLTISGAPNTVRLRSDRSVNRWGFEIEWVEYR